MGISPWSGVTTYKINRRAGKGQQRPTLVRIQAYESQQSRKIQHHPAKSANLESNCPEGHQSPKDARMTKESKSGECQIRGSTERGNETTERKNTDNKGSECNNKGANGNRL